MAVAQLSVFMENTAGRFANITQTLADAGANIRGFVISDTSEFGIVRFVVSNTDAAAAALRSAGFTVVENEVLVLDLSGGQLDRPGGLAGVIRSIAQTDVNIEYAYSLVEHFLAIRVADVDKAQTLLQDSPIPLLAQADIDAL